MCLLLVRSSKWEVTMTVLLQRRSLSFRSRRVKIRRYQPERAERKLEVVNFFFPTVDAGIAIKLKLDTKSTRS